MTSERSKAQMLGVLLSIPIAFLTVQVGWAIQDWWTYEPVVDLPHAESSPYVDMVASQLEIYRDIHGNYPKKLSELASGTEPIATKPPTDQWGRPLVYAVMNEDEFVLWSLGADGLPLTDDDILARRK